MKIPAPRARVQGEIHTGSRGDEDLLPARPSLLSQLRSWDAQDSGRKFVETYWRLIFDTASKAGLDEASAQVVVEETIIAVSKPMPGFRHDRTQGTSKGWLLQITKRRIADALRKRYRDGEDHRADPDDPAVEAEIAGLSDAQDRERLKHRVGPEQFQMFDLYVLQGWPVAKIAEALGVSRMQVDLARHRLGSGFRKDLGRLSAQLS